MADEITATQEKPSLRARIEEYRPLREKVRGSKLKDKPWKEVRKPATELLMEEATLGRTDILTGLLNLRGLVERLDSEIEYAKRNGTSIGILFLDLDNFKPLNDTYGHPKGNEYLKHLAKVLKGTVRTVDVVSRPGGDEFVFIIHDQGNIEQAAERLIKAVEDDPEGPQYWGQKKITASIGTAVARIKKEKRPQVAKKEREKQIKLIRNNLFNQADIALYQAKSAGRNNFMVYKRGMQMPEKEHGRFRTSS